MGSTHVCSIPNCDKPVNSRGWCSAHYSRWQRRGDPTAGGEIRDVAAAGEPMKFVQEVAIPHQGVGCLVWPYATGSTGRGNIKVGDKTIEVNRVIYEGRHGPPPSPEHEAAHNCGNGHLGCCNPLHLRWDTHEGNQRDRVAHGTSNRGEQSGLAKLNREQVLEIRDLKGKMSYPAIAALYGVSAPTISAICNRYSWAWLE